MNKQYNLSVIIPCYNVEQQIERCLESVINQSLDNIQIIIIDDASTDSTPFILRKYQETNDNIEIYRNDLNIGVGATRNRGLNKVKSSYVCFLDADDWIDSNAYLNLLLSIERTNADIALCGIKTEYNNTMLSEIRYEYPIKNLISGSFALRLLCKNYAQDIYISPVPGNKMFKSDFLIKHRIMFPERSFAEDDNFSFHCFYYADKVALVPNIFLHYYQREDSAMHLFSKHKIDDLLYSFEEIRKTLKKEQAFEKLSNEYYSFLDKCIGTLMDMIFKYEQTVSNQKQYVTYFFEQLLQQYTFKELLDYIDLKRIKRFFLP